MAIRALAGVDGAEVVTLTLDLGQGRDLEEVRDRALATGAVRAHVLDVREEFARDFVLPALRAGALLDGRHPMGEALAWPLIARKLVDVASVERATAVAHGCPDGDQQRIGACLAALGPVHVMAAGCGDVAQRAHANLWGRACAVETARVEAPDSPAYVEITFEQGVPVAINGVPMPLIELIESLSVIAGQHGVGWIEVGRRESGAPGVRDYAPAARSTSEVIAGFREIALLGVNCRFANCMHLREPGCAVKAALTDEKISARRYESYKRLQALTRKLTQGRH